MPKQIELNVEIWSKNDVPNLAKICTKTDVDVGLMRVYIIYRIQKRSKRSTRCHARRRTDKPIVIYAVYKATSYALLRTYKTHPSYLHV